MYNKKYELAEEFVLEQIKFCNFTSNTEKAEDWKEKLNNQVYYFIKNNNSSISVDFVHKLYISYNLAIQHSRFEDARNICLKVILYFNEKWNDFLNLSKKDEWEKRLEDVNYIINKNLVWD